MLLQIITHTPVWVFILLIGLLGLGFVQSKPRNLTKTRVILLPLIMVLFSLFGVSTLPIFMVYGLSAWGLTFVLMLPLFLKVISSDQISYSSTEETYFVPGSYIPLFLILAIFLTKYTAGVLTAMENQYAQTEIYASVFGIINGFFSAVFLSRALIILRTAKIK